MKASHQAFLLSLTSVSARRKDFFPYLLSISDFSELPSPLTFNTLMIFFLDSRLRCFTSEIRVDDFTHMGKSNNGPCDTRSVCRNLHIGSISTSHVKPGTRAPATTMGHIGTF